MKFLKYLERWEYHQPSSFWAFTLGLYFCFTTVFSPLTSSSENPSQARVVAEQVRCGGGDQRLNFVQKILIFFVPNSKPCPPKQNRQCPSAPLRFAPSFGSNPGSGGKNSGQGYQGVPHQSKWNSDPGFYRYDKNQDDEEQYDLSDKPVLMVNEESLSCVEGITKTALLNADVKKEYAQLKTRLENGVHPMDASKNSTGLGGDYILIKGNRRGRYLVEYQGDGVVNILGIADRGNKKNIKSWKKSMKNLYGVELKYTK